MEETTLAWEISKHDQDADIETTSGTLASETAYPYLNLI